MTHVPFARHTFDRRRRLTRNADFRAAYAYRARAADERLVLYARPNGRAEARLGLSVGRRCGRAVRRNRIKRLLREAFRQNENLRPDGYDLVVVALGSDYSLEEVRGRLARLVPQALDRSRQKEGRRAEPKP